MPQEPRPQERLPDRPTQAAPDRVPPRGSVIDDYAAIGDCKTIALVSRSGSIDWLCLPHFSGASVFASLLDADRGGCFSIRPAGEILEATQSYIDGTNVVLTRFRCPGGTLEVTDGMSLGPSSNRSDSEFLPAHELFRSVRCTDGEVEIEAAYAPRPEYATRDPHIRHRGRLGWQCLGDGTHLHLMTDLPFAHADPLTLVARERLRAGERRQASLTSSENDIAVILPIGADLERRIEATIAWWRDWSGGLHYDGPHREAVARSALTLKLLTYCLSGAIVAAGTTSIPVGDSGERNWDYRYCWLRDTSLILRAFVGLGQYDEADAFLAWLLHATRLTRPRLQVVYDVFGESRLRERVLKHLAGLHGLGPVRIGNAASSQTQLDLYGELMATAREFVERGGSLDLAERRLLADWARAAAAEWRQPDQGIWEIRLPARHNTHSKLMCWAALDGALWLDERIGLPIDRVALARERDAIRADIDTHAWDAELGGYVGWYGGKEADASVLLMLRTGFLAPDDPRMRGTVDLVERQLCVDGGLVYRYPPGPGSDGVQSTEGLFLLCSFWRVEALVLEGRVDEAQALFDRLAALRNPVGLYAEELMPGSLEPTGNFPQAFSHVGLISAALVLAGARPAAAADAGARPDREPGSGTDGGPSRQGASS